MNINQLTQKYVIKKVFCEEDNYRLILAHHKQTGLAVIIKELNPNAPNIVMVAKEFERECSLVRRIAAVECKNIIETYEISPSNNFYVMEYAEHHSLANYIAAGNVVSEEIALDIIIKIAEALNLLQNNFQILHRDVQPKSILLDKKLQPKLAGFGIIKSQDSAQLTIMNEVKGSFFHLAPELIYSEGDYSIQSDIYGLGLTFFFTLQGKHLFDRPDTILNFVQTGQLPTSFKSLENRRFAKIIFQMLARNPQDRIASYPILLKELRALQQSMGYMPSVFEWRPRTSNTPKEQSTQSRGEEQIESLKLNLNDLIKLIKNFKENILYLEKFQHHAVAVNALKKELNDLIRITKNFRQRILELENN